MRIVDLDIIVLSKDHPEFFEKCVERVEAQGVDYHGILVDNSSYRSRHGDMTRDLARQAGWSIVEGDVHLNYSESLNRAMSITDGKNVMWLSDDAYLHDGTLKALLEADKPIITPLIVNNDGSVCFAGGIFAGINPVHVGRRSSVEDWQGRGVVESEWVTTPAALIKRAVYDAVGPMDEAYNWSHEDVDFCLRAKRAGFDCWVHSDVLVTHNEAGTKTVAGGGGHYARKWREVFA